MQKLNQISVFILGISLFMDGQILNAQNLQQLEFFKRYDQIAMISIYQLTRSDCTGVCRDKAVLNAMRANILLGDNEGALLIANVQETDIAGLEALTHYKLRILKAYSLALTGDSNAYYTAAETLTASDQDRMYNLLKVDVPFVVDEIQNPVANRDINARVVSAEENKAWETFEQMPRKSPLFAGVSNLIIPGLGYAYLDMWQTAALNALLTGICIGSSIELFQRQLYFSGTAVATVGSVFYIGGALGAARSANDINRKNLKDVSFQLRGILLPELRFEF